MKKILFTEEQMKYILGEDFTSYLDKEDHGSNFPKDSTPFEGNEVMTTDVDGDGGNPTTDAVAGSWTNSHQLYRKAAYGTIYEDSKKKVIKDKSRQKIEERNHQLDGKTYRLGKNINKEIDNIAANNSGDKMINNMSKDKDITANCLYVRQNRLRQMKQDDPERYKRINGKRLEKTIGDTLDRATAETKTTQPNVQDTNLTTVTTVNKGSGKGHRKSNTETIYYENT